MPDVPPTAQYPAPAPAPAPVPTVNKLAYLAAIVVFAIVTATAAVLNDDKVVTAMLIAAFAPTVVGLLNMMKQDVQAVAQQATHVLVNSEMAAFKSALASLALVRERAATDKEDARAEAAVEERAAPAVPPP